MELKQVRCTNCGYPATLDLNQKQYTCEACRSSFLTVQAFQFHSNSDKDVETVKNNRQNLARALYSNDLNAILHHTQNILNIIPDDFKGLYYNAYASSRLTNPKSLQSFLKTKNYLTTEEDLKEVADHMADYIDLRLGPLVLTFFDEMNSDLITQLKNSLEKRIRKENDFIIVKRDVFICHRSTESSTAQAVLEILEKDGHTCWISSRNLRPDDNENYWKNISLAIKNCEIFLVISSQEAMLSPDIQEELNLALDMEKNRLEYKIDSSIHTTQFKQFFDGIKWINAINQDAFSELKERVHGLKRFMETKKVEPFVEIKTQGSTDNIQALVKRAYFELDLGNFDSVNKIVEKIFNIDIENTEAWEIKFLASLKFKNYVDFNNNLSNLSIKVIENYKRNKAFLALKQIDPSHELIDRVETLIKLTNKKSDEKKSDSIRPILTQKKSKIFPLFANLNLNKKIFFSFFSTLVLISTLAISRIVYFNLPVDIVFNDDTVDLDLPDKLFNKDLPFIIPSPTKEGYQFLGWYENHLLEGEPISIIRPGLLVNKTIYAKWIIEQYTLTSYILDTVEKLQLGGAHSGAITSSGKIYLWGNNFAGQLGDGDTLNRIIPYDISTNFKLSHNERIISIDLGSAHSSSLSSEGRVFTWGENFSGQLGDGTTINRLTPTEITQNFNSAQSDKVISIKLGEGFSAALTQEGRVFTWGQNWRGQLGNNDYIERLTPIEITSNFKLNPSERIILISLGNSHSAALSSEGRVFTWGYGEYGQLGSGDTEVSKLNPIDITSNLNLNEEEKIISIKLGKEHSAALSSNGRLFSWGHNFYGQIGSDTSSLYLFPIEITNNFRFEEGEFIQSIELGGYHSAALTSQGKMFTWGWNGFGQLGNSSNLPNMTPVEINSRLFPNPKDRISLINFGANSSAVITRDRKIFTWGSNQSGELGFISTPIFTIRVPQEITENFPYISKTTQTLSYNDLVTVQNPTRDGYTFDGWYTDTSLLSKYTITTMPAQDLILYGRWIPNE